MSEIIITTRQQAIDFLKARSIEDTEIKWTCPECKTVNLGAYYSHASPCGGCEKFVFPRLNLKVLLEADAEADEIARELKYYRERIDHQRAVVNELESELSEEKETLNRLITELKGLKSCDMNKVRVW